MLFNTFHDFRGLVIVALNSYGTAGYFLVIFTLNSFFPRCSAS